MGQQVWNMDSVTGDHYTVGLYHGEDRQRGIVYEQWSIFWLISTFLRTRNIILCRPWIHVSEYNAKKNEEYFYDLQVDRDTPTPLNTAIRKSESVDENFTTGMIVASILLLACLFITAMYDTSSELLPLAVVCLTSLSVSFLSFSVDLVWYCTTASF